MRLIRMSSQGVDEAFKPMFDELVWYTPKLKLEKNDVLLFEGGTDVSPDFYKEQRGKHTQISDNTRDNIERTAWEDAQMAGAACVGVCRGAQFLTVMAGGSLIQHVTGHERSHLCDTFDEKTIPVTSTHHQMMAPKGDFKLLAWASVNRSKQYLNGDNKDCYQKLDECFGLEPEIVWYPNWRSLAIQGHPEYQNFYAVFPTYCRDLVRRFIQFGEK